jgi:hypothetical protein
MCVLALQDSVHKLGSKTWIYLTRKITYADLPEIEKNFIKRFTLQLCAIFGIGSGNDLTHNISEN